MTTPTPMHDELVDALHGLVDQIVHLSDGYEFDTKEPAHALGTAKAILMRTPLGSPTDLRCAATNSGIPDYLACRRPLYRHATPRGQIDQCGGGHMSEVPIDIPVEVPPDVDPNDPPCMCGIEFSKHGMETHTFTEGDLDA